MVCMILQAIYSLFPFIIRWVWNITYQSYPFQLLQSARFQAHVWRSHSWLCRVSNVMDREDKQESFELRNSHRVGRHDSYVWSAKFWHARLCIVEGSLIIILQDMQYTRVFLVVEGWGLQRSVAHRFDALVCVSIDHARLILPIFLFYCNSSLISLAHDDGADFHSLRGLKSSPPTYREK